MADVDRLASALADRYRIERELGRGGMATVYLARDLKHDRLVAIKVLLPEVAAALGHERFLREIDVAAHLTHPHILPLHDSGDADGLLYYVMPYVDGESLRQRLEREHPIPLEDVLRISHEVADALDYAHRHGVIHRDIKPENILLTGRHALVADFGIARAVGSAGRMNLTTTGVTVGTPLYMSPEQALGDPSLDARSDIYALGCVVFEMLAGEPPFTGTTVEVVRHQHLNVQPPRLATLRPALPAKLGEALERALAKRPTDRFASAVEFAVALAAAGGPGTHRASRPVSRRAVVLSVLGAVVLIAAFAWWKAGFRLRLPSGGAKEAANKSLVLVAEFDGPRDDPGLAGAARDLIVAGLDESRIVATVPSDQIQIALADAGKPDSTRVSPVVARELAYRRSIRAVVEGRIARLGRGYSTVVRVVNPEDGKLVLAVSEAAHREADLIPSLERIAHKLRSGLGEHISAVQGTRPLVEAITPSFQAYRKYLKAVELKDNGDFRGAIRLHREALALDPEFAAAWGGIGVAYANMSADTDSVTVFYTQALRHADRLTEAQRFGLQSSLAAIRGDLEGSLSLYDRFLQENVTPDQAASAYLNRGWVLAQLGRYEDAVESLERSGPLWAFGPPRNPNLRNMEFQILLTSGHVTAASAVAKRMNGPHRRRAELELALIAGDWVGVDTLGTSLTRDESAERTWRSFAADASAASRAARGAVRSATAALEQAQSLAEAAADTDGVVSSWWCRLVLSAAGATTAPALPPMLLRDTLAQGLWAAATGDTASTRRDMLLIRAGSGGAYARSVATLLEGWIELRQRHWVRVVQVFGPELREINKPDGEGLGENRALMRWHLAEAYERLGVSDSAATSLELVISPPGGYGEPTLASALLSSFAHRRLVLLYARLERPDDARRHWKTLVGAMGRSDPAWASSIREARRALARAEAKHPPPR